MSIPEYVECGVILALIVLVGGYFWLPKEHLSGKVVFIQHETRDKNPGVYVDIDNALEFIPTNCVRLFLIEIGDTVEFTCRKSAIFKNERIQFKLK